mmetsp:Transcript_21220/g.55127  ORF Transcript_21220/g.55127 Transcript_21220/m.55127 type:complete len:112 (+) Transcript_21220:402-737(+)
MDYAERCHQGAGVVRDGCRGPVRTRAPGADAPEREREERDDIQERKLYDVDVEVQLGRGRWAELEVLGAMARMTPAEPTPRPSSVAGSVGKTFISDRVGRTMRRRSYEQHW